MADRSKTENKGAAAPPAENAAPPAAAAPPAGTRAEQSLSTREIERQRDLSQSGYRLPGEWFADATETLAAEKKIAANQPSTDGSKPHNP